MLFSTTKKPSIGELRRFPTGNLEMVNDASCDTGDLGEFERKEGNYLNSASRVESIDSLNIRSDGYGLKAAY